MQRTLTLKKIQYLRILTYLCYFILAIAGLQIAFLVINHLYLHSDDVSRKTFFHHFIENLSISMSFLVLQIPTFDCSEGFDSSLRFGVSRKYFALTTLSSYFILAFISEVIGKLSDLTQVTNVSNIGHDLMSLISVDNYLMELGAISILALAALLYYRYGWKILISIFAGYLLLSFIFEISSNFMTSNSIPLIANAVRFVSKHITLFLVAGVLLLMTLIYQCIQRFEIQS